jgi:hypothetical protein
MPKIAGIVIAATLASLPCSGGYAGEPHSASLYISDEILDTVTEYNAITGVFQRVLISAMFGPNGIIVNSVAPPELVVANQNLGLPIDGKVDQNGSASEGPMPRPTISRRPPVSTATAIIAATETMRPRSRTFR